MSMVVTARSPLEVIGMNGAGTQKRRSARLSQEGNGESEPPAKKAKINETTTTINTKQQDGESKPANKKQSRGMRPHARDSWMICTNKAAPVYERSDDDFVFTKKKRGGKEKESKQPAVRHSTNEDPPAEPVPNPATSSDAPAPPAEEPAPKTTQKKTRRRLPTTPERDVPQKQVRRSNRLSNDKAPEAEAAARSSPHKPAHAKSHANTKPSPSPEKARPLTVEKKRKHGANGVEEQKTLTIALPFADTPVMRRNKEMRKNSAENHRRSSAGMRGKRASSLIDEGRGHGESPQEVANSSLTPLQAQGSLVYHDPAVDHERTRFEFELQTPVSSDLEHLRLFQETCFFAEDFLADDFSTIALPHAEVPTSEFFKHISADLTEPRRMRCLLGWCGTRSLPPKPTPPNQNSPGAKAEFQALQAGV